MIDATDGEAEGPTDQALRELLRDAEHRRLVEDRRRRGDLRRQAAESLTLTEVLGQLADQGAAADVGVRHGRLEAVTVAEVGRDHAVLRTTGTVRIVPLAAITSVRPMPADATPPQAPGRRSGATFAERLADLALRRPWVTVHAGTALEVGRLVRAGHEILVLTDGTGAETFTALGAVTEVGLET